MYRFPTDPREDSKAFYDDRESDGYEQGFTTSLPSDTALEALTRAGFACTEKDYGNVISWLRAIKPPPARLYDFGCSWGYGSWQMARAGYDVRAYEISARRRAYAADKLAVAVDDHYPVDQATGAYDIFFSNHVFEHLPSLIEKIQAGAGYLRPGGILVAVTPNGSKAFRDAWPKAWSRLWGAVHPNLLDDVYYRSVAGDRPYYISGTPLDTKRLAAWSAGDGARQS